MEYANSAAAAAAATIRQQQQQQQQQQHQQLQQHQQEQQQQHEHQQQFCLRWHNHQTSLLSTLPVLLDQSHLTDVTISAEGRTLRAHRVVLSACSTFFLELFRALDSTNHPIIIIPGASFAAIVALLTFMYSGEVNVYEEQIPMLLNLAETLGIKGLADVQHNKSNRRAPPSDFMEQLRKEEPETSPTPASPPPPPPPPPQPLASAGPPHNVSAQLPLLSNVTSPSYNSLANTPLLAGKLPTPLESFFLKSLQFYPNLLPQPLNFSQTALNKTTELLAKYQQQCNLYQGALGMTAKDLLPTLGYEDFSSLGGEETFSSAKRMCVSEKQRQLNAAMQQQQHQQQQQHYQQQQQQQKDNKRIDKIVEHLRKTPLGADNSTPAPLQQQQQQPHLTAQLSNKSATAGSYQSAMPMSSKSPLYAPATSMSLAATTSAHQQQQLQQQQSHSHATSYLNAEDQVAKLQQQIDQFAGCSHDAVAAAAAATTGAIEVAGGKAPEGSVLDKLPTTPTTPTPPSPQNKAPSNSKLYATCFICHKQLSNQYNLRVHLETHQNVRYACNVCTHVSRSKDALRKHVSYRHPGAPSPCETDARRKRATKALNTSLASAMPTSSGTAGTPPTPTAAAAVSAPFSLSAFNATTTTASSSSGLDAESHMVAATQLSSAYMFLPNQFHLAAAAAAAAQQQQQQHMQHVAESTLTPTATSMNFTPPTSAATAITPMHTPTSTPTRTPTPASAPATPTAMSSVDIFANNNNNINCEQSPLAGSPAAGGQQASGNGRVGGRGASLSPSRAP